MLLHKAHQSSKAYSTTSTAPLSWRTHIKQARLASQISTILLQRRNWVPLLRSLSLFPKLTPPLFLRILHKTQNNPQVSLEFFKWAKLNMRFEPDLKSHCQIIQISLGSGLIRPAKPILDSLIQTHPVSKLVQCMTQPCRDGYSRSGNFDAAFYYLNEMCERKVDPGFSTCSSILDGACKFGDVEVVERVMNTMVEKKLLPKSPLAEYDSIVEKLCDLGKTHAAEMFFKKACDFKIGLQDTTYGCVLKAWTKEVRIEKASWVYRLISEKGIVVDDSSYHEFADVLCKEERSEEGFELLMDVIRRGFSPCASELSGFTSFLCQKGRWREAEDMLNVVLDKGLLPDSICCSSLMGHYCSRRRIDSAIALHNKMEKLNGSLDVTTYNVLLSGLFGARRIEEAVRVFDYMRNHGVMSSASFTIMVRGLCRVKELRKAMKIHDEMLKKGLKPDAPTYKRLISGFM